MPASGRTNPVLLADIGGTYCRFAVAGAGGRPENVTVFNDDEITALDQTIQTYLSGVKVRPRKAVMAVAGPMQDRKIRLTNRAWMIDLDELERKLGFAHIHAVNDFEAIAWALARLQDDDLLPLGDKQTTARLNAPKAVLGPGTGLGVAALLPAGRGWMAVASEGGHVTFGPAAADEEPVFARLRQQGRSSAEAILSGPGLGRLHVAMNVGAAPLAPREISARAIAGDPSARATIALFTRLLGRFAGDVALTFKATGGVYISGGVARRLGALLDQEIFRAAFEAHPPYHELLKKIPTYVVVYEQPGLLGCAALADDLVKGSGACL